jgi:hypothetical protein
MTNAERQALYRKRHPAEPAEKPEPEKVPAPKKGYWTNTEVEKMIAELDAKGYDQAELDALLAELEERPSRW